GDLPQFQTDTIRYNQGEEHRHNFLASGQGYGHVMFLNLKKLVQPVSIGSGIMLTGPDEPTLRVGIDNARSQGATVLWCHNTNGHEKIINILGGKVHALNVFDGSRTGTYAEDYYRYLNVGQRLPITTGTDWFMYDFSRVYARMEPTQPLTAATWLETLKAG